MYKDFLGNNVTVIVSSRANNLLEYKGTIISEDEQAIILSNVDISYMMLNIQRGIFGGDMNQYRSNVEKVIINKRYIISCDK